jgi:NDP-sugar pyrophosphorylase family protein
VAIENSAIMDRAIVEPNAHVKDSIIGRHVTIRSSPKKPTCIESYTVIADDVILAEGCKLATTKVYPHQYVKGEFENQTLMPG